MCSVCTVPLLVPASGDTELKSHACLSVLDKFRPRTRVFALVGILGLFSLPALPEPVHEVMLHPAISFSCAAVVPSQLCRFFLFRYSAGRTTGTQKSILDRDMPSVLKGAGLFIIFLHVQAALVQL